MTTGIEYERLIADCVSEEGDYTENGVLMCGKCHTPKEVLMAIPELTGDEKKHPFPVRCQCAQARFDEEEKKRREIEFQGRCNRLWNSNGVHDRELMRWTFADDDGGQGNAADVMRKYCEKWPEMVKENVGILLYGPVGTGKSFLASCVCNEILRTKTTVGATSFGRLLNCLMSAKSDKQEILDSLSRFSLLFVDDLGSERSTEFALETVFSVIDSRYRSEKPVIITTNLPIKELENPQNLAYSRIYDRVLEMCPVRLAVTGPSRRTARAEQRRELARALLLGGEHDER